MLNGKRDHETDSRALLNLLKKEAFVVFYRLTCDHEHAFGSQSYTRDVADDPSKAIRGPEIIPRASMLDKGMWSNYFKTILLLVVWMLLSHYLILSMNLIKSGWIFI